MTVEWQTEPKPADMPAYKGQHRYGYLVIFNGTVAGEPSKTQEHADPQQRSHYRVGILKARSLHCQLRCPRAPTVQSKSIPSAPFWHSLGIG